MAEIGQRVFAVDGTRPFLRLYREEFVRPFSYPTAYKNIRLVLLFTIADTGGTITTAGTRGFIGFCNGTRFPYTSGAACVHAYGFQIGDWGYTGGANPYYRLNNWAALNRINGTDTTDTIGSFDPYMPTNTGSIARRGVLVLDVDTTSMTGRVQTAVLAQSDATLFNLLELLDTSVSAFSFAGSQLTSYQKLPTGSATTPQLNTVNIFWQHGQAPLEIYALGVYITDV